LLVRASAGDGVYAALLLADPTLHQLIALPMIVLAMPLVEPFPLLPADVRQLASGASRRLALRFTLDDVSTRMFVPVQDPPWRVVRAFPNAQNQAVVHLHNVSGGILAGDDLHLSIDAGAGARVQVTAVSGTRIYRHRAGRIPARLSTSIRVGEGAMVEYLPDVNIPFAGSRFHQSTEISLGPNAGFIGWEILSAGRIASGEEFAFDLFQSECSIRSDTRPLALERYSLTPATRDLRSVARWGRFRYTATMYVCHTGVAPSRWIEAESSLNEAAFLHSSPAARWGGSALVSGGLVIRGMALEAHQITDGLHTFWDLAKQQLWGEPALPPRRIK
jgi:urease accessory protein